MTKQIKINLDNIKKLFGSLDSNIRFIEKELNIKAVLDSEGVLIEGEEDNVIEAERLITSLITLIKKDIEIDKSTIKQNLNILSSDTEALEKIIDINNEIVTTTSKGKRIYCKGLGQREYIKAIKSNTITFSIGPAGTGKTYLAVALAYALFKSEAHEKIILTRPALEAGEKLGFLPGDLQTKVDPYLRPLYDALTEMFGLDSFTRLMEKGALEVAPLAYMRGRTLSNSFIILDEAQNTTKEQMKMFLTRLGYKSKMVITGDITQIDLPFNVKSGLVDASETLKETDDIAVIKLTEKDVVRHELVQRIILAYQKREKKNND